MSLDPIGPITNPKLADFAQQAGGLVIGAGGKSDDFGKMLMDALKEVNASQQNAAATRNDFMAGRQVDPQDLSIAMEKASAAMQLTMAVRNKVLEAYQEIERMQV